ncbi:ABC transporter ATP-binding protein [Nakamurella sp.]|uniref:ABC transporter ATP-binding protein n=1 Tax=Nakamurella sp. TaxID=1869182 RepID=UPI003B3A9936
MVGAEDGTVDGRDDGTGGGAGDRPDGGRDPGPRGALPDPGPATHAWSAVDRPGTDPSDPRPQGPDTGGFADVPWGAGAPAPYGPAWPAADPAAGPGADPAAGPQPMRELGPTGDPVDGPVVVGAAPAPGIPGPPAGQLPPVPPPPPGPALVATGLGLLGPSGWVFQNIDLTLRAASVAAVVGPSGTGRSSLLLALSGRLRATAGTLSVAGHSYRDKPSAVRQLTAIARVGAITVPEPVLTVREFVTQRCLLEDVGLPEGRTRFAAACDALQLQLDPAIPVGTLSGDKATLLAVAAACVRVSAVIMLDDLDRGVSGATQQLMLDALLRLAGTGPTIVVTTTDRIPVMEADVVLDLTPTEGAAVWQFDRNAPLPAAPAGPVAGQLTAGPAGSDGPPPDEAPTTVLPPQPGLADDVAGFAPPPAGDAPAGDAAVASDAPPDAVDAAPPPTPPTDEPNRNR